MMELKKIRSLVGCSVVLGCSGFLCLDFGLWSIWGREATISSVIQEYLGTGVSLPAILFIFVCGGLLVHWSRWGKPK